MIGALFRSQLVGIGFVAAEWWDLRTRPRFEVSADRGSFTGGTWAIWWDASDPDAMLRGGPSHIPDFFLRTLSRGGGGDYAEPHYPYGFGAFEFYER